MNILTNFFNDNPKIQYYIDKESPKWKLTQYHKDKIISIVSNYMSNRHEFILKNNFKYILQMSDEEIFDKIYNIFGTNLEGHELFYLKDVEYLYLSIKSKEPKIKKILIAFLIFQNEKELKFNEINRNISKIFRGDDIIINNLNLIFQSKIAENTENINKKKKKNKNKEEDTLSKKDFINGNEKLELFVLKKVKRLYGSNSLFDPTKINDKLDYVCDCSEQPSLKEENYLDSMKSSYIELTNKSKNILYFKDFIEILKKASIHKNLIELVIDYLKRITQKDYCCFIDLKNIFSYLEYSSPLDKKKRFLFEMLVTIYNSIDKKLTLSQIEKYLKFDPPENGNTINANDVYGEEELLKENSVLDDIIKKINTEIENFGLLPYLLFKVKSNNKKVKRKLIQITLKNEGIDNCEKYLEKNFVDSNDFYAIDINFWNKLMNENEEAPEYVNNSNIAKVIDLVKTEDKLEQEIYELNMKKIQKSLKKDKNKKENPNKGNDPNNKKEEENKKNEENKNKENSNEESNNKDENSNKNEDVIIMTKQASLKKGLKYKKDFIILCGELYKLLKNNYKFDYLIKLKKITRAIKLKDNNKKEEIKKEEEKKDNEEKKEDKENEKKEKENENEKEMKEEEDDEENEKKKKLINEKLDKFIYDEEKDLISKIIKRDDGNYSLNEIDIYPIKIYFQYFGAMVRTIEKAKKEYDKLNEKIKFLNMSEEEQNKINKQKKRESDIFDKKVSQYKEQRENLIEKVRYGEISGDEYKIRLNELQEKYKEIFKEPEKKANDYVTDITLSEFTDTLKKYKNTILIDNKDDIKLYQRYKTYKDILNDILNSNPEFRNRKFDAYYFKCEIGRLNIPPNNYNFESEGKVDEELICVLIDMYNNEGKCFHQLLLDKEKEQLNPKNEIKEENKKEEKKTKINKKKKKAKNGNKKEEEEEEEFSINDDNTKEEKLTKEEQQKIKLEKKQKEKEEKERKKLLAQEEKKREKEEKERQKQLEIERERQKEREKYTSPPYGMHNQGNTCYFNSVNQIFVNLPILQQIFLDPKIIYFINKENKFGHQGKFFEIYKSLYWIKPSKVDKAIVDLKKIVGKLKEDFNNNEQQDANEYLNFVLESLHEELNLHSKKIYIENDDDIFHHNKPEDLGNIYWANNLKRNTSFIDSIFMFQLKSNLKCKKCKNIKYNFETNYVFDLPLSLCRMVTVQIHLYRLPFIYKIYFDKINKDFEDYIKKDENKSRNMLNNLWNYYTNELTNEQKNQHVINLNFAFDLEREKKMIDITKILRGIKILELEPENIVEVYNNEKLTEYKVEQLTDLITYSKEKNKIIHPYSDIDKFVNIEDKIILNVYEILNSNGMKLLFNEENNKDNKIIALYSFLFKANTVFNKNILKEALKNSNSHYFNKPSTKADNNKTNNGNSEIDENKTNESNITLENNDEIKILSLKEQMTFFNEDLINNTIKRKMEFSIPIFNYYCSNKQSKYLFRDIFHEKILDFPVQYIMLNNTYNITPKQLYEYIWNLDILYMNHPRLEKNKFWWNYTDNEREKNKIKKCYPFVLRYTKIPSENAEYRSDLIHCPICPWYSFCPGCIIDPKEDKLEKLKPNMGIVVDWCFLFIKEELISVNFKLFKEIKEQEINENLPIFDKDQAYQSIQDCFDLFFVEENLEDPLYCHYCLGPQDFSKRYSINKLPYVLILSLKRFKFNQNSNFKLRQMITYPLYDLSFGDKKYDLYGIINHYGSINSGHYTAIIKNSKKEWIMCDDSSVYKIEEKRVMHSNAYILFYICQESPYKNDYIKFMKSVMNSIVLKEGKASMKKDLNFFKGEPVTTKYGDGYVMEENLTDFKVDENFNIYDQLKKEDDLRVEKLIKRDKENDEKNKKDKKEQNEENKEGKKEDNKGDKNEDKKNEENDVNIKNEKDKNKDIKEDKKEESDSNKNEDNQEKKDGNDIKEEHKNENISENNDENSKQNKEEMKSKNNEEQINDIKPQNDEKDKKENNIINEDKEDNNNNITINEKDDKISHPECYKDFVKIKFGLGEGMVYKWAIDPKTGKKVDNIKKYNFLKIEQKEQKEKFRIKLFG